MGLERTIVYLDACTVIYLVEEHEIFFSLLENKIASTPNIEFAASGLTKMECLILPLRNRDKPLIKRYQKWFDGVSLLPFENAVFEKATEFRTAHPSLKTPDALHMATATHHDCDEFWTNDSRLNKIAPLMVKDVIHS